MKKKAGRPRSPERRRKRNIGEHRSRLDVPDIPGFEVRWVNDVRSRIHDFTVLDDWEFVTKEELRALAGDEELNRVPVGDPDKTNVLEPGEKICRPVGRVDEIPNAYAFLLKKRKDFFWEDHKKAQDAIDKVEKQIKNPSIEERHGTLKITRS